MAENKIHNLDEGVEEYFEFTVRGHNYRFKQLNMDELEEVRIASLPVAEDMDDKAKKAKEKESKESLFKFITPVGDAPKFEEVSKKMTVPHWNRFNKMVAIEMGLDDDNQSPKST